MTRACPLCLTNSTDDGTCGCETDNRWQPTHDEYGQPITGCPLGGPRCPEWRCDCFIEQFPADPLGLHPELFVVGRPLKGDDDD